MDGQALFRLRHAVYDELVSVSEEFESSIQEIADNQQERCQDDDAATADEDDDDVIVGVEDEDEPAQPLQRSDRPNRGNRYPTVLNELL